MFSENITTLKKKQYVTFFRPVRRMKSLWRHVIFILFQVDFYVIPDKTDFDFQIVMLKKRFS